MYEVFGKANCQACKEAVKLLENAGEDFVYKQLFRDFTLNEFYDIAPESHKTFPMVAKDGKYLGTLLDLKPLL